MNLKTFIFINVCIFLLNTTKMSLNLNQTVRLLTYKEDLIELKQKIQSFVKRLFEMKTKNQLSLQQISSFGDQCHKKIGQIQSNNLNDSEKQQLQSLKILLGKTLNQSKILINQHQNKKSQQQKSSEQQYQKVLKLPIKKKKSLFKKRIEEQQSQDQISLIHGKEEEDSLQELNESAYQYTKPPNKQKMDLPQLPQQKRLPVQQEQHSQPIQPPTAQKISPSIKIIREKGRYQDDQIPQLIKEQIEYFQFQPGQYFIAKNQKNISQLKIVQSDQQLVRITQFENGVRIKSEIIVQKKSDKESIQSEKQHISIKQLISLYQDITTRVQWISLHQSLYYQKSTKVRQKVLCMQLKLNCQKIILNFVHIFIGKKKKHYQAGVQLGFKILNYKQDIEVCNSSMTVLKSILVQQITIAQDQMRHLIAIFIAEIMQIQKSMLIFLKMINNGVINNALNMTFQYKKNKYL